MACFNVFVTSFILLRPAADALNRVHTNEHFSTLPHSAVLLEPRRWPPDVLIRAAAEGRHERDPENRGDPIVGSPAQGALGVINYVRL
jgi:hypothetical protein